MSAQGGLTLEINQQTIQCCQWLCDTAPIPGVLLSSVINALNLRVAYLIDCVCFSCFIVRHSRAFLLTLRMIYIRIKELIIISDGEMDHWNNSWKTELSAGFHGMPCIWMKILKCVPLLFALQGMRECLLLLGSLPKAISRRTLKFVSIIISGGCHHNSTITA